jgi:hypothetical protein
MNIQPIILGSFFCDQVLVHPLAGQYSLIGLFNAIILVDAPAVYKRFWVYTALTNGRGSYKARTALRRLETSEAIWQESKDIVFQSPRDLMTVTWWLPALKFPAYGSYQFELALDSELLLTRKLEALKAE